MSRKNIFDMIDGTFDTERELRRIKRLFEKEYPVYNIQDQKHYSIRSYVGLYGFYQWRNRGRCVDAEDFLATLGYEKLWSSAPFDVQDFFTLIEIIYNFCWIVKRSYGDIKVFIDQDDKKSFALLEKILIDCLAHYNFNGRYFYEREQLIVIEDKPEATAVAEIVDNDLGYKVLRYNHYMLKGDLQAKKDILLALGADLEPKRAQIKTIDKDLEDGIFYILNNLNLRHNNKTEGDKHYKQAVAEMDSATLENWYDELYQMILLAYLQLDQTERNNRVKTLKQIVSPKM